MKARKLLKAVLLTAVFFMLAAFPAFAKEGRVTKQNVTVRSGPGTSNGQVASAASGLTFTVTEEAADSDGNVWYHISYMDGASQKDGWIRYDMCEITAEDPVEEEPVEEIPAEPEPVVTRISYSVTLLEPDTLPNVSDVDCTQVELQIGEETFTAFKVNKDDYNLYLVYGVDDLMNYGWYVLNADEGSAQSYSGQYTDANKGLIEALSAENEELKANQKSGFSFSFKDINSLLLLAVGVLCLILLIIVIVLAVKLHNVDYIDDEDYDDEDDEDEYDDEEYEDDDADEDDDDVETAADDDSFDAFDEDSAFDEVFGKKKKKKSLFGRKKRKKEEEYDEYEDEEYGDEDEYDDDEAYEDEEPYVQPKVSKAPVMPAEKFENTSDMPTLDEEILLAQAMSANEEPEESIPDDTFKLDDISASLEEALNQIQAEGTEQKKSESDILADALGQSRRSEPAAPARPASDSYEISDTGDDDDFDIEILDLDDLGL